MEPIVRIDRMTVRYQEEEVVKEIGFSIAKGEILGIVGESGSGKSTIIKAVMGLLGPGGRIVQGDIYYRGRNIKDLPQKEKTKLFGPEIGIIFQDCKSSLCPVRRIEDQIYEYMAAHSKITKKEAMGRVKSLMCKIGLTDTERVLKSYPFQLSGGMNQRVGICMAMILQPALLLADEPTSALDVTMQKQVVEELLLLREEYQTSMVLVSHNMGVIREIADKVMVLKEGRIVEYGTTSRVLHAPKNDYTKKLMDAVLTLKRECV